MKSPREVETEVQGGARPKQGLSKELPRQGEKQHAGSLCHSPRETLQMTCFCTGGCWGEDQQVWDQRAEKLATCFTSQKGRYSSMGRGVCVCVYDKVKT